MKKSILFITFCFIVVCGNAQVEYTPFQFETSIWQETSYAVWFSRSEYDISVEGDTLIDDNIYYKLMKRGMVYYYDSPQQTMITDSSEIDDYLGAIREYDFKRVEYIAKYQSTPITIYDFNLEEGDTTQVYDISFGEYVDAFVASVDTVEVCGTMRNRYRLQFIGPWLPVPAYLIEGIGSTNGIVPKYELFESAANLICYSNSNCDCFDATVQSKIYICQDDRIIRSNLDGSNVEDFITNISPAGLSIDHSMGLLFWSDLEQHKIFSTKLDGSNTTEILSYSSQPKDVELDTINHKIYWTANHTDLTSYLFYRADYDGTNQEYIYDGLHLAHDLILNYPEEKLYWVETSGNLSRVNTDWTDFEILSENNNPRSIAINPNENKIYFTDYTHSIYKSNFDGSEKVLWFGFPSFNGVEYLAFDSNENKLYGTAFKNIDDLTGYVFRVNADLTEFEIIIDSLPHNINFGNRRIVINHFNNMDLCTPSYSAIDTIACGTYVAPDGQSYNSSGEYTSVIPNEQNCDSIITINLVSINIDNGINQVNDTLVANESFLLYQWVDCNNDFEPIPGETNQSFIPQESGNYAVQITVGPCTFFSDCADVCINTYAQIDTLVCESYLAPDNQSYNSSGLYSATILNLHGCDSIITINLEVFNEEIEINQSMDTLLANPSGLSYQWMDCNNNFEPIANENNQFFLPVESGSYAVQISNETCDAISDCVNINIVNTQSAEKEIDFTLSPNPSFDNLYISTNFIEKSSLTIFDALGNIIASKQILQYNQKLNLEFLPKGVYFAVFQANEKIVIKKFVKI